MTNEIIFDDDDDDDDDDIAEPVVETRYKEKSVASTIGVGVLLFVLAVIVVINAFSSIAHHSATSTIDAFNTSTGNLYKIVSIDGALDELNETYENAPDEYKTKIGHARQVAQEVVKAGEPKPLTVNLDSTESAKRVSLYFAMCDLVEGYPTINTNLTTISLVDQCRVYKRRVEDMQRKFSDYGGLQHVRYVVPPFIAPMGDDMPAVFGSGQ